MKVIGNVLWFLCGGLLVGLEWIAAGCLWCITIIGIPVGLQCFKLSVMSFWPFGRQIVYEGGSVSCLLNVLWVVLTGWELALSNLLIGLLLCITIIGIPFGKQFFKLAKLSLMPFGAAIMNA